MGNRSAPPALVPLSPVELAELLELAADDAPYLAKVNVHLPAAWVGAWKSMIGPRELTPADVQMLTGMSRKAVYKAIQPSAVPCLRSRSLFASGRTWLPKIAPVDLVLYLRAVNAAHGLGPVATETPTQQRKRAQKSQAAAIRACRGQ